MVEKTRILQRCARRYLRAHGFYPGPYEPVIQSWWRGSCVNSDTAYVLLYPGSRKEERKLWALAPGLQKRLEKCQVACNAPRREIVIIIRLVRK